MSLEFISQRQACYRSDIGITTNSYIKSITHRPYLEVPREVCWQIALILEHPRIIIHHKLTFQLSNRKCEGRIIWVDTFVTNLAILFRLDSKREIW